jgi:hypothetical protein
MSGDGAAVGSGRRGGVLVGGRLRRGGGVLGAVLRLAVEAGKVVVAAASERDEKHDVGGKIRPAAGSSTLLKGASGTRAEGVSGASSDAWGRAGARERGPGCGGRRVARGADACD